MKKLKLITGLLSLSLCFTAAFSSLADAAQKSVTFWLSDGNPRQVFRIFWLSDGNPRQVFRIFWLLDKNSRQVFNFESAP